MAAPARTAGRSWALTIVEQRIAYQHIIDQNPGMKPRLNDIRDHSYKLARILAAREADLDLAQLPSSPPDWTTILVTPFDIIAH